MRPRIHRAPLQGNEAILAENVNLWHGTIEVYRTPLSVDLRGAPNRTTFLSDAGWVVLPGINALVSGLPGCPRIVAVGTDFRSPMWADAADAVAIHL